MPSHFFTSLSNFDLIKKNCFAYDPDSKKQYTTTITLIKLYTILIPTLLFGVAANAEKIRRTKKVKVDICHRTGNGKVVLLNIAENAVEHDLENHGDCLADGELCVGAPGVVYNEVCESGLRSECPCLPSDNLLAATENWVSCFAFIVSKPPEPTNHQPFRGMSLTRIPHRS